MIILHEKTFYQGDDKISKVITIRDVAEKAGVSVSSACKALLNKGRIGEETREKIKNVAKELGYKPNKVAQALSRKPLNIGVIIPKKPFEVERYLKKGIIEAFEQYTAYNVNYEFYDYDWTVDENEEEKLIEKIKASVDALIIASRSTEENKISAIFEIKNNDIPVIALVSDIEYIDTNFCVTVNGEVVGKMAAEFMNINRAGKNFSIVTGQSNLKLHKQNVEGFMKTAKQYGLNVLKIYESFDSMERAYDVTKQIIDAKQKSNGIFVTSYVAPAVCKCLKDNGLDKKTVVVGLDLYDETIEALNDGSLNAVIFQNQKLQAKTAVDLTVDYLSNLKGNLEKNIMIKPEIVLKSNLECYKKELEY